MLSKNCFYPSERPYSIWPLFLFALAVTVPSLIVRPAWAVGLDPVPTFVDANLAVQIQVETLPTSFGSTFDRYVYAYSLTNPDTNTGEIWYFKIDISEPMKTRDFLSPDLTLPRGLITLDFENYREGIEPLFLGPDASVVPIGQTVPSGWLGGFGRDGFLGFARGNNASSILPGQTLGGFEIRSRRLPSVRRVEIIPDWALLVENHDEITDETLDQAAEVEENLRFKTFTLGPAADFQVANFRHFNRIADEINKMIEIGWIDAATGGTLLSELEQARQAREQFNGTEAKAHLQAMADLVANLRAEVRQLIQLNVEVIIERTPDTPPPFIPPEPVLTLTPPTAELPLGTEHTVTLTITNAADNNQPFPEYQDVFDVDLDFEVAEGPHAGFSDRSVTFNSFGEATFSYVGVGEGLDVIHLMEEEQDASEVDVIREVRVRWTGGPDLAVPFFRPPVIITEAGKTIFIADTTTNLGNLPSTPSVTRYFLSDVDPVDPLTATVVGERQVDALEPGEDSDGPSIAFTIPSGFPPGTYFMAACADDDETVAELEEDNNCSFNQLKTVISISVPMESLNNPPDCTQASANPSTLWPPNHKLVPITITGVTDADDDPLTLIATSIQQDEPVDGVGDGNTSPDGFGIGTAQASVRSERSGQGNGRVYVIGFSAEDPQGGNCTGGVLVGVLHDQGQGAIPVDDGVRFDSTQP
jgi:hypothetical protein